MQTGDCAGFGEQPNATARRSPARTNMVRALWVGGLAVAGSVFAAASANAAETDQVNEPSGDLVGSLTSAVEPVTGLAGSLAPETDALLTDELALSDELLGDDALLGDSDLPEMVERPVDELAGTVGLGEDRQDESPAREQDESPARENAAEREAAATTHTDRSMRRTQPEEPSEGAPAETAESATDTAPEPGLSSLVGTVDQLLASTDVVPEVAADAGELATGITNDVLDAAGHAEGSPRQSTFSAQATSEPLGVVTDLVSVLDMPLAGGAQLLEPLAPLLPSVDPVVNTGEPLVANVGPTAEQEWRPIVRGTPAAPSTLAHTSNTSADAVPRNSLDETGAARPAGQDGDSAVIHSSPDAGTDGQDPSGGTRGGLRPSLLVTPVVGLTALHMGAPGAAVSVDQAGPSSHALLPGEAELRARLFSAAAYARNVEAKPQREANDPPVSPD